MKKITLRASIILVVVGASMVTGCSREPSENDILNAYAHEVDQTNNLTRKFSGNAMEIKVNTVKKINCTESTLKRQYNCHVDINLTLPIIGQHQQRTMLILAKGSLGQGKRGWIVMRGDLAKS